MPLNKDINVIYFDDHIDKVKCKNTLYVCASSCDVSYISDILKVRPSSGFKNNNVFSKLKVLESQSALFSK